MGLPLMALSRADVTLPDGRSGVLTTEHSASSYGIPVLVVDGVAYGSAEASGWRLTPVSVPEDLGLLLAARGAGYRIALPEEVEVEPWRKRVETARRNGRLSKGRPQAASPIPLPDPPEDLVDRNALICELARKGVRQAVLARHFGLSRQAVYQILNPARRLPGEPDTYEELLEGELSWGSQLDEVGNPRIWTDDENALVLLPLDSRTIADRIKAELGKDRTPGAVLKQRSKLKRLRKR